MMSGGSALVFGGGRGIGLAVAEAFADSGLGVTVAARTPSEIASAVELLSAKGPAMGCAADVAEPEQVLAAVAGHVEKFGEIRAVINAAALQGPIGCVWDVCPDDWRRTVVVNLVGSFNICRAVLPVMRKQDSGTLIFFSGAAQLTPGLIFPLMARARPVF